MMRDTCLAKVKLRYIFNCLFQDDSVSVKLLISCLCRTDPFNMTMSNTVLNDAVGTADKKDILSAEIEACERLLKYTVDETDRKAIEIEISELKMALDLMSQ